MKNTRPESQDRPKPSLRARIRKYFAGNTVRSRVTLIILLITALSMMVVGVVVGVIQYRSVLSSVDDHLKHSETEVREFADRIATENSLYADQPASAGDFILQFMREQLPVTNEGMMGFIGGELTYHQGELGIPVQDDSELVDTLKPLTASNFTEWTDVKTATGHYRALSVPVVMADGDSAAIVFVYEIGNELAPVRVFIWSYLVIALITILCAGIAAWWAAGRVMEPLARLRDATTRITEHNFDERIPIQSTDDLADVSRSFNAMLDRMAAAFTSQYQLLDDAGHELRTPVTIVQGHLELMDVNDPDDVAQTRELALGELDRMRRLTDDLVLLAKTERPDFLQIGPVDVTDLMHDAFTHAQQLGERNWKLGTVAPIIVDGDAQRLLQALLQLAANAVKFSELESTITLSADIHGDGSELYLSVADEGLGIARENQTRIFERFGRVDASRTGAGLGLSIVAGIAHSHGGDVALTSQQGRGSTFSLVLPLSNGMPVDSET
ncbi:sensor histidine kinase [Trueperella bialowiezensis]|uniref:histidine kinase n=1 Tax=Trueperella bialowiezensis TaxID=312285 RepID=A0A448PCU0_9ACTO|nr:HAMP domain-containing sensor histidine kinase [Trueperella bialowiezensis]VEI12746.1 Probable sensor histidine kinase TcrY [Trueperella bialowiezensis]